MKYCDIAYADAYFGNRAFSEAWQGDDKEKYLATASELLARYCVFFDDNGDKVSYDDATAPDELKKATCEEALYLLNLGFDPTQPKKVNTLGIASTEGTVFDRGMTADVICGEALRIVEDMGGVVSGGSGGGISSGYMVKV